MAGGLALYAAHPPLEISWLGLLAVAPLIALGRDAADARRPVRCGFGWGMVAGSVFFAPLLVWVINVEEVVAWLLLVPVMATFVGAFVAGVAAWGRRPWLPVAAVVWWVGLEALRTAWPLGGFPWGVLGYTQQAGGPVLAVARALGVLGVSAVCAGFAASVEAGTRRVAGHVRTGSQVGADRDAGHDPAERRTPVAAGRRARAGLPRALAAPFLAAVALLAAGPVLGGSPPQATARTVDVAGIQGFDVEGSTGRSDPRSLLVADRMVAATREAVAAGGVPELTVWPENALDGDLSGPDNPLRARVEEALGVLDGAPLLSGLIADGPEAATFLNNVVQFDGDGRVVATYTKRKLVPFGEYVPFRPLLDWFPALERVPNDGVPGDGPLVFDVAGARVGSVICFESIFPDLVHSQVRAGANLLVVTTNNSSFGRSAASRQHIAFSQLRAVETGRWVVHAALTGSSAIVDPHGNVHQQTGLYEQAIVRADLPLVEGTTLATRLGDVVGWLTLLASAAGLVWLRLAKPKAPPEPAGDARRRRPAPLSGRR